MCRKTMCICMSQYLLIYRLANYYSTLKGYTSHKLLKEYRHLSKKYWGQHLWTRGYFVSTTGVVTDEVIQKYIEGHEVHGDGDGFRVGGVSPPTISISLS